MSLLDEDTRGVAVVTGAGRGIGRNIAVRLAAAGYGVGITARSSDQLAAVAAEIEDMGRAVVAVPGDVTDPASVREVLDAVTGQLGEVDVLVNNAGQLGEYRGFVETDPAEWWRVVETNVRGPALYSHAILPSMIRRGRGHVVNMNSLQGSRGGETSAAYSVSKAALMRFTDTLAGELAGTGVVMVDLSPGLVRTGMVADRPDLAGIPDAAWTSPEVAAEKVVALVSGRFDGLSGRFVHVTDDLGLLQGWAAGNGDGRTLRITRAGADDSLSDA